MNIAVNLTPAELALGGMMLPHARMEDWRWTNLRTLIDRPYPPGGKIAVAAKEIARLRDTSPLARMPAARLVFVNGAFSQGESRFPASGEVGIRPGLPRLSASDEPVASLNANFATDGLTLTIRSGANIDTPIELLFLATDADPRTIATRVAVDIGAGASATLIETFAGEGSYLANSAVSIALGEGARLDRVTLERQAPGAIHLADRDVTLQGRAVLRDFTLTAGAKLNRQNARYTLAGEHADARIAGAYLLGGRQHADTRLVVRHAKPHCTSREIFKCVMDDHARGIFQGKVIVDPGAQKTDGKQSSHALLLSETAEFDAKPELEIFADDVVCGHGATSGDLDHNHLFYLRSRGIPEREAKAMLVAAFVEEAFETIGNDHIRAALGEIATGWLASRGGAS
ncbi:MAG: Fe-S cluster assembly protein SufD [Rhizobiales bacterium]|nr:Fe-S cluster assembly protein SufD [Hyphomicrobiales bacterium]